MKYRILTILVILLSSDAFSQQGLNKNKEELMQFIRRPAYYKVYPEVTIDGNSITTLSSDLQKGIFYSLNTNNVCDGEVMRQRVNSSNYENVWEFFKRYLDIISYKQSIEADNKYVNSKDGIVAYMDASDGWLSLIFRNL